MNWTLILQLSLFGLAMGVATVFVIPSNIEPVFWLAIFIICAYIIALQAPGRYFLHGLMVSIVNSVWVTGAHVLLFSRYVANHAREAAMMEALPLPNHPRLMMICVGAFIGLCSGLVLGLLAVIASKLVAARPRLA